MLLVGDDAGLQTVSFWNPYHLTNKTEQTKKNRFYFDETHIKLKMIFMLHKTVVWTIQHLYVPQCSLQFEGKLFNWFLETFRAKLYRKSITSTTKSNRTHEK